jgi:uncharacterized RDD family membrane protein YckC
MSDVSQGPGWWQASDGKWYSPAQAAGAAPTSPPPAGPPPGFGPPSGPPAGYGPPSGAPVAYGPPGSGGYGAPAGYPQQPGYATPVGMPEDLKGARIGARAIDIGIVLVVSIIISVIFGASLVATSKGNTSVGAVVLVSIITSGLALAYELLMLANGGATLGKKALGLKVVNQDGSPVDLAGAAKRHSPTIIARVIAIIPIIGLIGGLGVLVVLIVNFIMLLSGGASLYDKVGNTKVIRAR